MKATLPYTEPIHFDEHERIVEFCYFVAASYIRRQRKFRHLFDECVSEALVGAARAIATHSEESNVPFAYWLRLKVSSSVLGVLRTAYSRNGIAYSIDQDQYPEQWQRHLGRPAGFDTALELNDLIEKKLSPHETLAIHLRYWDNAPLWEIGAVCGFTEAWACYRHKDALNALRDE